LLAGKAYFDDETELQKFEIGRQLQNEIARDLADDSNIDDFLSKDLSTKLMMSTSI